MRFVRIDRRFRCFSERLLTTNDEIDRDLLNLVNQRSDGDNALFFDQNNRRVNVPAPVLQQWRKNGKCNAVTQSDLIAQYLRAANDCHYESVEISKYRALINYVLGYLRGLSNKKKQQTNNRLSWFVVCTNDRCNALRHLIFPVDRYPSYSRGDKEDNEIEGRYVGIFFYNNLNEDDIKTKHPIALAKAVDGPSCNRRKYPVDVIVVRHYNAEKEKTGRGGGGGCGGDNGKEKQQETRKPPPPPPPEPAVAAAASAAAAAAAAPPQQPAEFQVLFRCSDNRLVPTPFLYRLLQSSKVVSHGGNNREASKNKKRSRQETIFADTSDDDDDSPHAKKKGTNTSKRRRRRLRRRRRRRRRGDYNREQNTIGGSRDLETLRCGSDKTREATERILLGRSRENRQQYCLQCTVRRIYRTRRYIQRTRLVQLLAPMRPIDIFPPERCVWIRACQIYFDFL